MLDIINEYQALKQYLKFVYDIDKINLQPITISENIIIE